MRRARKHQRPACITYDAVWVGDWVGKILGVRFEKSRNNRQRHFPGQHPALQRQKERSQVTKVPAHEKCQNLGSLPSVENLPHLYQHYEDIHLVLHRVGTPPALVTEADRREVIKNQQARFQSVPYVTSATGSVRKQVKELH